MSVNIRWYHGSKLSSFWQDGSFLVEIFPAQGNWEGKVLRKRTLELEERSNEYNYGGRHENRDKTGRKKHRICGAADSASNAGN